MELRDVQGQLSSAPPAVTTRWRWRAPAVTLVAGVALMVVVAAGAALAALLLRTQEIDAWKRQASAVTLLLAEQTFQSLSSAELLIESVARDIESNPPRDADDLRRRVGDHETFETLRDRSAALPQIDVVTIISPEGEILSYSRGWPAAPLRVTDRDYFRALSVPGAPRNFLGEAARSKVNGRWVFFLARRIVNRAGGFGGIVLAGLSIEAMSSFYGRIAEQLGADATVTLMRRDFTLVARYPFNEAEMGMPNPGGTSAEVIQRQGRSEGIVFRDGPRGYDGTPLRRMAAVRMVGKYPLLVNVSIPESSYLAQWRQSVRTIAWVAGGSVLAIGVALVMLVRMQRRRRIEQSSALELRLQAETARAASDAKTQFLSMMSHEIRTPLNGVIGANQLLRDTALDERQRELVRACSLSADALMAVIDDVLDFSRIEAGKLALDSVDFDLADLIEDVLEVLASRAATKPLVLAGWVEPGVPARLRGDPARIRQVLLNLIGNAIKFTDHGEVTVRVEPGTLAGGEPALRFEVGDTGIGVAPDRVERLFEVFSQVDVSAHRRHGGTGLGLAISRRLVELMGGRIGVHSLPRAGSTFWFELPWRAAPAVAPDPGDAAGLAGRRVLLVDANASRCRQLRLALERAGCQVLVEPDTVAAAGVLRGAARAGQPIDAIVLASPPPGPAEPFVRPGWAGGEVATVPMIVLGLREAVPAHAIVALPEPVRRSRLARTLRRALGLDEVAAATRSLPAAGGTGERGAHVLLVEDNDVNRMVAEQMLKLRGHSVDCAEDGSRALAMMAEQRYQLVLMDCQMPGMDGFEAARAIRAGRGGVLDRDVPIVALTANVTRGDQEAAFAAGMNDFLSKPVDAEKLAGMVSRWAGCA